MSEYLPEEVIVEILWRLPIKTILRCTSVCKLWYSLITNANFISTHLHRSISLKNNLLVLRDKRNVKKFELHPNDNDFREYMPLVPPFDRTDNLEVVGSCNGIICMHTNGNRFVLWNPSIRKCILLPSPRLFFFLGSIVGFGFDSKTGDYKVLKLLGNFTTEFRTELYSLKENSWRDITDITPKFREPISNSIFVNGALHWIGYNGSNDKQKFVIMVFDLRDGTFHEIMLPQLLWDCCWDSTVGRFGESSIALFLRKSYKETETDIWVMKEYGVVASWMMLGTVGKPWRGKSRVMGFRNNGDVLLVFFRKFLYCSIASQNIESKRVKILLETEDMKCDIFSYEESLELLGKGNDVRASATSSPSNAKRIKISN